jgi:hypothetical protein
MESFWSRWHHSALWSEAGFLFVPDYDTVRLRFVEMENLELERSERGEKTAFRSVADLLIRQARQHEPRIGQVVHVDGTAWQTHASLIHDCPDPIRCRELEETGAAPERASYEEMKAHHQAEAKGPEPDEDELPAGAGVAVEEDEAFKYIWFSSGHRYRTRDKTAGARMHGPKGNGGGAKDKSGTSKHRRRKKKFWLGGTMIVGIDHFLRAPLAVTNIAADEHEHHAYPPLMDEIIEAIGECPLAMSGDKAESITSVFEYNTTRTIASVIPWRQPREDIKRRQMRADEYDEHGIPRCRYCGGPTQLESGGMGFYLDGRGKPRLREGVAPAHSHQSPDTLLPGGAQEPPDRRGRVHSLARPLRRRRQERRHAHEAARSSLPTAACFGGARDRVVSHLPALRLAGLRPPPPLWPGQNDPGSPGAQGPPQVPEAARTGPALRPGRDPARTRPRWAEPVAAQPTSERRNERSSHPAGVLRHASGVSPAPPQAPRRLRGRCQSGHPPRSSHLTSESTYFFGLFIGHPRCARQDSNLRPAD